MALPSVLVSRTKHPTRTVCTSKSVSAMPEDFADTEIACSVYVHTYTRCELSSYVACTSYVRTDSRPDTLIDVIFIHVCPRAFFEVLVSSVSPRRRPAKTHSLFELVVLRSWLFLSACHHSNHSSVSLIAFSGCHCCLWPLQYHGWKQRLDKDATCGLFCGGVACSGRVSLNRDCTTTTSLLVADEWNHSVQS